MCMANPDNEPLTFMDVAAFLKDRKVQIKCGRCRNPKWLIGQGDEAKGLVPVGGDSVGDFHGLSKSMPVHFLVCTNCGNVEFFASKVIRKWKADRKSQKSEDGESDG